MNYILRNYAKLSHFNYDQHGKDWQVNGGKQQSPISLIKDKAVLSKAPKLSFLNYNKTFSGPLNLINNGHTVTMAIPPIDDGRQPAICGCKLKSLYKAVQLHFHWGSLENKGSEHTINYQRYDGELHILHQNSAYKEQKEAIRFPDGFVVLAVMLKIVQGPKIQPRALNQICSEAAMVRDFNKASTFVANFTLRDVLTGIERQEFFTYMGSLTTPPCSEVVNWFVFPKHIEISKKYLQNLWLLTDERGKPLVNNYRNLQRLCNRTVYYRNASK
ncbi:uncharacterized protein Dvir_GJ23586, isoform A [Drosophila virilis]|uniref:Carbonic anhydrase n=1 Tax=Drosophila virilis TaxID=7244 RepID=B4LVZ4_DROVI|nr:carbonic anhydrase 2 isoform X1 [Drosophila virilis]EDW66499.1 uncharacterized protein Dvir_GJ23586, isoform A [Drosophila virilis]